MRVKHAFPYDYRAGPSNWEWDPSKWIIILLSRFGQISKLRQATSDDIANARLWMSSQQLGRAKRDIKNECEPWAGPCWTIHDLTSYLCDNPSRCLLYMDGYIVDTTHYLKVHVRHLFPLALPILLSLSQVAPRSFASTHCELTKSVA
jgi:stearoyl-CoA desaturase (delta-9 desaturase)